MSIREINKIMAKKQVAKNASKDRIQHIYNKS